MKNIIKFIITLFIVVPSQAQISKAELIATGLTCSMCSKATYKQLQSIPGVEKITTDINSSSFIIQYKAGAAVNVADIRKKVQDAGFSVGSLVVEMNLKNVSAANNSSFTYNNSNFIFVETPTKSLNGVVKLKLLDKGFITDKEFKQMAKNAKQYPSYNSQANAFHVKPI
jgi:copper chaperone CopZ